MLPGGEETTERGRLDGLDLFAQRGQGAPSQPAQHLGVTPLRAAAGGSELSFQHPALRSEPEQGLLRDRDPNPQPSRHVGGGERAVGAREAGYQVTQGVGHRFGESAGCSRRDRHAEAVAESSDVLDRRPPRDTRLASTKGSSADAGTA